MVRKFVFEIGVWDRMFGVLYDDSWEYFGHIYKNVCQQNFWTLKFSGNFLCFSQFSEHIIFKFYVNKFLDFETFRWNFRTFVSFLEVFWTHLQNFLSKSFFALWNFCQQFSGNFLCSSKFSEHIFFKFCQQIFGLWKFSSTFFGHLFCSWKYFGHYHPFVCSAIRFYTTMWIVLKRESEVGIQRTDAGFRTIPQTLCSSEDLIDFDEMFRELLCQWDRFTTMGSGWTLENITEFTLHISHYRPLIGSSYLPSPDFIVNKKAVINVENRWDNECFKWSILSALHVAENHSHRLTKYKEFEHTLNWIGLTFPTSLAQIRIYERNYKNYTVNVMCTKQNMML